MIFLFLSLLEPVDIIYEQSTTKWDRLIWIHTEYHMVCQACDNICIQCTVIWWWEHVFVIHVLYLLYLSMVLIITLVLFWIHFGCTKAWLFFRHHLYLFVYQPTQLSFLMCKYAHCWVFLTFKLSLLVTVYINFPYQL